MLKALVLICWICILGSASGTDIPNEVTVTSAKHSKTKNRDESQFSATFAVDSDMVTKSWTLPGSDGEAWLKFKLEQVHCVRQIVRYWKTGGVANTWTCTDSSCTCEGNAESCGFFTLVISVEGEVPGYLPPSEECKYGDSVMIQRTGAGFSIHHLSVAEMIVAVPDLSIVKKPESVSTVVGSTVTLVCEFNRPAETYGWRYRTTSNKQARVNEVAKLASGKWEQRDSGHLVISGVDKYDSGKYTCFGRDGTKNVFAPAEVTVNYFDTSEQQAQNQPK
ncbi:uncharacterized protein LOC134813874 [Bolinopsis microptera]|uniref:uncharacterized protein LOC134813874 n=1 Tax=Bolinopsis microptera TaxID=2820187 RepID=UPI00307A4645